jgi:RNA polymerase sigma-70 factor (ECF subfamily)
VNIQDDDRTAQFRAEILACLPRVRAFARSLGRNSAEADDLVQATVVRALAAQNRFEPGTNLMGWLYTILRNVHTSELRARSVRVHQHLDSTPDHLLQRPATQLDAIEHRELRNALRTVPLKQREALILVVMVGCSYEEAAAICRCEVGTIKSRVNRAKTRIAQALGRGEPGETRRILPTRRSSGEEARCLRVLIVEDELVIATEYERMVAELGGTAIGKAATADAAAALAERHHPDLVLMDVRLRGAADGVIAAQQIQARQPSAIAFVTAYHDEETRRRIEHFNGSKPLHKPLARHDLAAVMYASSREERTGRTRRLGSLMEKAG